MPKGDKYKPLTNYLIQSGKDTIQLSFQQLEEITGGLPPSAYVYRLAWSDSSGHSLSYGWLNAGYSISADFKDQTAVFHRTKSIISDKHVPLEQNVRSAKTVHRGNSWREIGQNAFNALTKESLESAFNRVMSSSSYGEELKALTRLLHRFPSNTNPEDILIKLAVIDVTHSTQLSKHKSQVNIVMLSRLMSQIQNMDARIQAGDQLLVTVIAGLSAVDLLSMASKYCACHNQLLYEKDDYFKYDSIVTKLIGYKGRDYREYCKILDRIVKEKRLQGIHGIRRKLDTYLWDYGRTLKVNNQE